ncbi:MAG TPA: Ig domain-containing protein, partial [Archangium sp.]|uniref:Ig domain-containing protein n=1 Tax=Archangium sp. TaxID=1872627 RepID=UPI002ED94B54
TCLVPEGVCLPDCGERGPCTPELPSDTDGGVTAPALVFEPDVPPVGLETGNYLYRFQASGGTPPYTFSFLGELPPGLSLNARGELSGRSTAAGDFRFTLAVMDQGTPPQHTSQERTVLIRPLLRLAGPAILADVPSDMAYVDQVSATGGTPPHRFELVSGSALPAGILLKDTGRVEGMTSQVGTFAFEVRVTDSDEPPQVVTRTLQLTTGSCRSLSLCMRTRAVPDARVGTEYTHALQTTGGAGTLQWSYTGTLPPGITLGTTGVLSGTPTQAGSYEFTVSATDVFDKPQVQLTLKVY